MTEITLFLVSVTDCDTGVKSSKLFNLENSSYHHYNVECGLLKDIEVFTISYDLQKQILSIPVAVFNITGKILSCILDCTSMDITLDEISICFY